MGGLISRIFRRKIAEDESRPKSKKGRRFGSFRRPKSEEPQTSIHQSRCNTLPSRTPLSQIESGQTIEREERRRETMQEVQNSMGTSSQLSNLAGETAQIPRTDKQEKDHNIAHDQLGVTEQTEDNINDERFATMEAVPSASEAPNQNNSNPPTNNIQPMWTTEQDDIVQVQREASGEKQFIIPDKVEIAQITNEVQHDIPNSKTQPQFTMDDSDLVHVEYHDNVEAKSVISNEPGDQILPDKLMEGIQPDWTTKEEDTIPAVIDERVEATPTVPVGEEDVEVPSELQHEISTHEDQPEWTTEHEDGMHLESDARAVSASDIADETEVTQISGEMEHGFPTGDTQPALTTEYDDAVRAVSDSHVEATPTVPVGEEDVEVPSELQHEISTHEDQPEWTTEHEDGLHLESDARAVSASDIADETEVTQISGEMEHEFSTGNTQPALTTVYDDAVRAVSDSHVEATPTVPVGEEDVEVPSELQHEISTHEDQPEWPPEHGDSMQAGSPSVTSDIFKTAECPADVPYDVPSDATRYDPYMEQKEASSFVAEHTPSIVMTDMGYFERSACETPPDLIAHPTDDAQLGDDELRLSNAANITEHPTASYAESVSSLQVVTAISPENVSSETVRPVPTDTIDSESPPAGLPDVGESRVVTSDDAGENILGDQISSIRPVLSFPDEFPKETPLVPNYQSSSNDKPTNEERLLDNVSFVHSVVQSNSSADDADTVSTGVTITSEVENEAVLDANLTTGLHQWTPKTSDLIAHSLVDDVLDHAACSVTDNIVDSDLQMTEEHVYHDNDSTLLNNSEPVKLNGDYLPSLNGSNHKISPDKEHLEADVLITATKQLDLPSGSESLDTTPQESTQNPTNA